MSEELRPILNRMCEGYLNSWWCIQPRRDGDWSEYPVEAQASHLLANELPVANEPQPSRRKRVPVCESPYWSPGTRTFRGSESEVHFRADVWSPDFHAPPAPAGWFFELKLAHLDADAATIGGEWWSKIVSGFTTDIQRLLAYTVPDGTTPRDYGLDGVRVRCSFVLVLKGATAAFGTKPFLPEDDDPDWVREPSTLTTAAHVNQRIWDRLDEGRAGHPGRERIRSFFDAARAALRRTKGVTDVELVASDHADQGRYRVQVVAISWLQSAPIELE